MATPPVEQPFGVINPGLTLWSNPMEVVTWGIPGSNAVQRLWKWTHIPQRHTWYGCGANIYMHKTERARERERERQKRKKKRKRTRKKKEQDRKIKLNKGKKLRKRTFRSFSFLNINFGADFTGELLGSRVSRWSWYGCTTRAWRMITALLAEASDLTNI